MHFRKKRTVGSWLPSRFGRDARRDGVVTQQATAQGQMVSGAKREPTTFLPFSHRRRVPFTGYVVSIERNPLLPSASGRSSGPRHPVHYSSSII
jgi:hypothetical protein